MIRRPFQHRRIAWLGLVAVWLVALAPVVSQTLYAARAPLAPHTPVAALVEAIDATHAQHGQQHDAHHGMHHGMHHAAAEAPPAQHDAAAHAGAHQDHHANHDDDPLHACDYCELFAHAPIVFAIAHPAPAAPPAAAPARPLPCAPAPRPFASLVAAPRGPPHVTAPA